MSAQTPTAAPTPAQRPSTGSRHTPQASAAFEDAPEPAPPAPAPEPAAPAVAAACPPPPAPPAPVVVEKQISVQDPDSVFRSFSAYVDQERRQRLGGAILGSVFGGALITVGAILDAEPPQNVSSSGVQPEFWYVLGGATMGVSLLSLLLPTKTESIADAARASESGHSAQDAAALEAQWQELASDAKRMRTIGGVLGLVVGSGAIVAGAVLVSGDTSANDNGLWGGALIGGGAGLVISAPLILVLPSPVEASFTQYQAAKPRAPSLAVGLNGLGLAATGSF